jgi:RNA-directed DNA polymerase
MKRVGDKVRVVLSRRDTSQSLADKIQQLNPIVRGWGIYFRRINSTRQFQKVDLYVTWKLRRWLERKHGGGGMSATSVFFRKAGLHLLSGTVSYVRRTPSGEGSRRAV